LNCTGSSAMTGFDNFATAAQASTLPLVETITTFVRARIDDRALRAGMRMPSIRQFAADHGVSRFTVVEAYDRLVAQGHLESRRGSGFYVRERAQPATARPAPASTAVDIVWLLRQMYADHSGQDILLAGSGYLPSAWLDEEMIAAAMRSVARRDGGRFTAYGTAQGYAPLRELLQLHLEELEINAHADQIVLTAGASQALDMVARHFLQPGDTVLVDEPGYYVLFGRLAATGVRLLGVPRTVDGVDVDRLEELVKAHKPRLYFLQSVLHNPTGTSLSAATAFRILRLAETHDFFICEDDVYSDLHPGRAHRVAALDQLKRVLYVGSFSKSLGAGLRVGYVAASNELAQRLSDHKMLASLTTPELNERLVHQILSEGQYRKHTERLRARLRRATEPAVRNLEKAGLKLFHEPKAGMFVWARADENMDAEKIAAAAQTQNILIAPGSLFSTTQARSPWMRFHVAHAGNPKLLRFFDSLT
jgi:DNA-binding transcriptional MocR family regulator